MSFYHQMDWDLSAFNMDDLVEPRDILTGKVKELPNKDVAIAYAVMDACLYDLKQRAKDLAVPYTSDEANQIWMGEVENLVTFMEANFPLELLILGVRQVAGTAKFPSKKIAPRPNYERVLEANRELFK